MKVLSIVVICCSIYTVNCYGPPPKSKKGRTTTTTTETAPTDDGIVFPDQENNVGPPVSYIQNNGVGSYGGSGPNYGGCGGGSTGGCSRPQGQPSYSPQGQQPQPSPQNPSYSPQFPQSHSPQSSYNPQGQQPQSSYNPQGQQPQSSYNPQYPQGQQTAPSPQQPTYNPQYPQGKPPPQSSYNPQTPQGQQPQQSYNPQGQQPQQPGGNYWWQGASSPFNPQQQPPSVPSQSPGNNIPPQNGGQAVPPSNHNQPSYVPTHSGPSHNHPAGGSPSKPIDIQSNPFLSSALAGNKPSSCGSYGGAACKPQAPNQGAPAPSIPASNQPIACNPGSYGSCNTGSPPHSPTETPLQPGSPTSPIGAQPVPPKPVDIGNNPFLSSALNKPSNGCAGSYSGNCGSNQQPNLSNPQGQNQYPATQQPQYPGSQTKPLHPGLSQIPGPQQPVQSQYPGSQQPGQPQGNPHYPGNQSPGQPSAIYPGSQTQPQGGQQYPNSQQSGPLANQQYPGGNQYPNGKQPGQGNQQSPESSYQGLPQGSPQKFPGSNPSQQPGQQGFPQPSGQPENPLKYPGSYAPSPNLQTPNSGYKNPQQSGQQPTVNIPGDRPQQYPNSPSQVKPSYPQYGSAPTPGQQYTPQFPSSGVPCNQPNQLCVTKSACQQGVLTQTGVPGRAGFCNTATEVCCKIPTGATPDKQAPPTISYGNRPGTNGVPIGGSIYDTKPNPSLNSVTLAPTQQPYTGPLNTTPYPGCPAALKCVPITYCTAEGVMADNPVYLTREQQDNRVPLTDCMNLETNTQGKCCRDPNYKDPWPAGMMMGKTPAGANFDDGQYHPPATDNGQYHPPTEQETSGTFSHEAGIYYNVPSSTPKGHTIKKPIGNFNQNPTAFPTKPAFVNGVPVRQPAPVHEKEFPEGVNPPSNEILPPNGDTNVPSSPIGAQTYQPGQPSNSIGGGSYNPTTSGQPKIPVAGGSYNPTPSGQPSNSVGGGSYSPTPSGQSTIPVGGGSYNPTPSGQPSNPAGGSSYNPSGSGYQPNINEPSASRPDQPANGQPLFQPNTQNEPKQPPNSISPSYQPGQPDSSYQPKSPANQQLSNAFPIGQPQPGSSCGIRHQAYSTSPEDAGFAEFPWQALVSSASNKTYICGAAIIADTAVITAAHCVEELRSKDIVIKAGEWKLLSPSEKPVQVRVAAAVARHPQFSIQTLSNDLAIIVISQGFTFDDHVDKICLPSTPKPTYDQSSNCVVTGWGRKQLKAPIPGSVLHKVDVKFIPEDTCESKLRTTNLGKYFILSKGFSCALPKNPSDLCKVDVGSPIACDRGDGHYELAGVNSWDVGCQTDQTPTISSNPDAEWIDKVINTPAEQLAKEEEKYFADKLKGESIDDVDIDQKPGFALGYGK